MKLDAALADFLRERGATDNDIAYLRHSDAVTELLSWANYREDNGGCVCCDGGRVHYRDCKVFAAWHALEMHEALDAIDAAHEAALHEQAQRAGALLADDWSRRMRSYMSQLETHLYRGSPQRLTVSGIEDALLNQARNANQPAQYFINSRDAALIEQSGAQLPRGIAVIPSQFVPEGTAYLLGEQTPLDDAPTVDDGDRLDVDDP